MLIVTTPAKSFDLTLLATVKAELGITDRGSDAKLKGYIRQASDAVAQYCNRVFPIETVTETFRIGHLHQAFPLSGSFQHHNRRHPELILKRYPITGIMSVTENDVVLDATMYELDPNEGTILRLCNDQYASWATGKTVIVYSAGFTIPTGLPSGVERAAIMLVKQYAAGGDRDPLVRTERVDGAGTTEYYQGDGTGLPPDIQGLLNPHIRPNG